MIDYLAHLVAISATHTQARNVVREYLQARILESLYESSAMIPLAFHGGTALRFLYNIPRYSEDLDFALDLERPRYNFRNYLHDLHGDLSAQGYDVRLKVNDTRIVHSAFIQFVGLLYHLGLSPHRDETLSIKIEVDTNPPAGATLETTVVRRHVILRLQHHDRASLLAGKLHAVLQRSYVKGRDLYDLLWYLSDPTWPPPNFTLLNNALRQTGWDREALATGTWRGAVRRRIEIVNWDGVLTDVQPFLENATGADLLNADNLARLLA
jgi:predicted nucleotidyltransferase component of viral defense system